MTDVNPDMLPAGLSDMLPPEAEAASWLTRTALELLAQHGYAEVRPPLVEYEYGLARRMTGSRRHDLFRMVDPASLRTLAIRADITVQVGRIAATLLAGAARPLRLSYAGPVLQLTSDQLAPERERLQIGAELIGHDNVAAASEIVGLAVAALTAAGVEGISVDLALPDLVETPAAAALPLPAEQLEAVRRELDMKDAGALRALGADRYLPLLYAMGPFDTAIEALAGIDAGGALASRIRGLRAIAASIPKGVTVTLDPTERHGFEYQSWFGFSLYAAGCAGSLGRGGTYAITDGQGGTEVATGFSLYPDPLIQLGVGAVDRSGAAGRLFLPRDHDRSVATRLRALGWQTIAALDDGDDAVALGCTHRLDGTATVPLA